MLEQFIYEDLVPITYYHIGRDVKNKDNINKAAFEASHSSTTNISFFDEDLLLGSAPHNQPPFVIDYAHE